MEKFRPPLLLALLALLACEDTGAPPLPHGLRVTIAPATVALLIGEDTSLTGDVSDSLGGGAPYDLAWNSADTTVATVDAGGMVHARGAGATWVTARAFDGRDSARVTVLGTVASLTVAPSAGWVTADSTVQYVATLRDSAGRVSTRTGVFWSSGDTTIATISPSGVVRGVRSGGTTIDATLGGVSNQVPLTVLAHGLIVSLHLEPTLVNAAAGAVIPFQATVLDTGGRPVAGYPLLWTSGDTTVLKRDSTGAITARKAGVALLTVSAPPGVERVPTPVTALVQIRPVRFQQVESGDGGQNCGVATDSLVYCWGYFDAQAFGIGNLSGLETGPIAVTDSIHFKEIHGGEYYDCGLSVAGLAYCWGQQAGGRLGAPFVPGQAQYHPVAVTGGHVFTSMGTGHSVTCGIEASGAMWCWGRNSFGEVGGGVSGTAEPTPVAVLGGITWHSVAAGTLTTCGIATDSAAYCWGQNFFGQLGIADTGERNVPTPVAGGHKFVSLSSSNDHTCGVTDSGAGLCWGYNGTGALGDSTTNHSSLPVPVAGGLTFTQISAGGWHGGSDDFTCGLTTTGAAYCWGKNDYGQLGNGTTSMATTPQPVAGGITFATITAGAVDACGISTGGVTYCWGASFESNVPVRVPGQP